METALNRVEKFKFLKECGLKLSATTSNVKLDELIEEQKFQNKHTVDPVKDTTSTLKTVEPSTKGETVTISKDQLDEIMKRMQRLENTADKARMQREMEKDGGDLKRTYRISEYNGKLIQSWSDLKTNKCWKNLKGEWEEDITMTIQYFDGTEEDIQYRIFTEYITKVNGQIVSETKFLNERTRKEETTFKLLITQEYHEKFGEEVEINSKFIN